MAGEFELIDKYFSYQGTSRDDVLLAQGDDCAVVEIPEGYQLAISTDTLVSGTHFLPEANPAWLAHKTLASNISDLAAMGATPAWVSMAITLPDADERWLEQFSAGFYALARQHNLQLIGGDTTRGPLCITLTIQGLLPAGKALTRSGAKPGDEIFVSGTLGDSKAGLEVILDPAKEGLPHASELAKRHFLSSPRVALGEALRGLASSCIDISDGLMSDLPHILRRSKSGAVLDVGTLPISAELQAFSQYNEPAWQTALTSGEEYELCFTLPPEHSETVLGWAHNNGIKVTKVGEITNGNTLQLRHENRPITWDGHGFDHFRES